MEVDEGSAIVIMDALPFVKCTRSLLAKCVSVKLRRLLMSFLYPRCSQAVTFWERGERGSPARPWGILWWILLLLRACRRTKNVLN